MRPRAFSSSRPFVCSSASDRAAEESDERDTDDSSDEHGERDTDDSDEHGERDTDENTQGASLGLDIDADRHFCRDFVGGDGRHEPQNEE